MELERRAFIKQSCKLCASIAGITFLLPALESCAPLHYYESAIDQGLINVPVSQFIEGSNLVIVKNEKLAYNIVVVKSENQTYKAFELKCTHQDNPLVATKSGFFCNAHGSSYDLKGKVNAPPATTNLKEYITTNTVDNIIIKL